MKQSCVQIYTGDGKGKTTAALGLAVRAAGQGLCVKIVQFLKGRDTGELRSLERLGIEVVRASDTDKFFFELDDAEKAAMRARVHAVLDTVKAWLGHVDVLVLDEVIPALTCGLVTLDDLLQLIDGRGGTEMVLTGRDAPETLVARADLVTEMCAVKHYMDAGVAARKGIEY